MQAKKSAVLLYLHGFQSSPQSLKATQTQTYIEANAAHVEFVCPQLACTPLAAWQQIESIIKRHSGQQLAVMGSSLGGFLADKVAQQWDCPSVLINPAVHPYVLLSEYIGEHQHPYTGETFSLSQQHMSELKDLEILKSQRPLRQWVMLQTGDEVLDVQFAIKRYRDSRMTIECGGDHSFQGFHRYLPEIQAFLF
ncbi:esterase YqiA [Alginatibacterium sediminis]|uniref:Esterase YqiA n=1 Tax=Alginatibacterium sediminis TaxID=2164068 RepID=A0A420ECR4_9ALTE|nr:YqiA/YcfP family alpha/beta fold hydrolase [Alginatibacterium sediminis]RKF18453.1 esterase YqiA [Alginatibacterium sediminis]